MFCPKCGSILVPKKEDTKRVLACSCGYKDKGAKDQKLVEKFSSGEGVAVINQETETLPLTDAECPKCKHKRAYFWTIQTRAADEPETKFLRCEKCRHTWRDYS